MEIQQLFQSKELSAYDCYVYYTSLKAHFTNESYDFIRYNGKLKYTTVDAFEKNKTKYSFLSLSKKDRPFVWLFSSIVNDPNIFIKNILTNNSVRDEFLKRRGNLLYHFKNDLGCLLDNYNENIVIEEGETPFLLKQYLNKTVSLETVCILNKMSNFIPHWESRAPKLLKNNILKIKKYNPFLDIEMNKYYEAVMSRFDKEY